VDAKNYAEVKRVSEEEVKKNEEEITKLTHEVRARAIVAECSVLYRDWHAVCERCTLLLHLPHRCFDGISGEPAAS
jgi:hypothetical protein